MLRYFIPSLEYVSCSASSVPCSSRHRFKIPSLSRGRETLRRSLLLLEAQEGEKLERLERNWKYFELWAGQGTRAFENRMRKSLLSVEIRFGFLPCGGHDRANPRMSECGPAVAPLCPLRCFWPISSACRTLSPTPPHDKHRIKRGYPARRVHRFCRCP